MHGWQYLDSERSWLSKLYWFIIVAASVSLSLAFTIQNIEQYSNSGTVTSINTTTASLNDTVFPSFVLCNVNQVTASFLRTIGVKATDDRKKLILFEQFMDGVPKEYTVTEKDNATYKDLLASLESVGWDDETPFYKLASQNCSDMVLQAEWKNIYKKEFHEFFKSATDYGACCLITPYLDFEFNDTDKIVNWHSIPKGITRNGIQNGLKVTLDVENYDYAYFQRGAKGFRAVVGDARDKAVVNQNGFYIAAGK